MWYKFISPDPGTRISFKDVRGMDQLDGSGFIDVLETVNLGLSRINYILTLIDVAIFGSFDSILGEFIKPLIT